MQMHKTLGLVLLCAGCVGVIEDANSFNSRSPTLVPEAAGAPSVLPAAAGTMSAAQGSGRPAAASGALAGAFAPPPNATPTTTAMGPGVTASGSSSASAGAGAPNGAIVPRDSAAAWDPTAVNAKGESVGVGEIGKPALGPAPLHADKAPGAPFVLVKNWDFGADGTITQMSDLIEEFQFHDQFGTIANGTNYGSVTVAPNEETAVSARDLGLPNNRQPIDDPARPYREFTPEAIRTYVRPLSSSATSINAARHDAGNGSFMAKWELPKGGSRLQQDVLWESRVRIPTPARGFWFSLWTAGQKWNRGAEMDVVESFGTPNIGPGANAFHVNSVGGRDKHAFSNWISELTGLGVPTMERDLSDWHTFTWIYLRDDTYQVYYDDYLVQQGSLQWTLGGSSAGEELNMSFLFDFGWGHTQVSEVNISLPVAELPLTYELDYSRVYVRR